MNKQECCKILGVPEDITLEQLKPLSKKIILKFHPDRNKEPDVTEKFIRVKEALETLMKILAEPPPKQFKIQRDFFDDMMQDNQSTAWSPTYTTINFSLSNS